MEDSDEGDEDPEAPDSGKASYGALKAMTLTCLPFALSLGLTMPSKRNIYIFGFGADIRLMSLATLISGAYRAVLNPQVAAMSDAGSFNVLCFRT